MTKGQTEASFQWIFVLLAGAAFLGFFFILIKGCSDQGTTRSGGVSVQSLATRFEAALWRPDSVRNWTVQETDVLCPAGVLTLRNDVASSSIDRAAVFLPPSLNGKLSLATEQVGISVLNSPEIKLGNMLYAIDEDTQYRVIKGALSTYEGFAVFGDHPNVQEISVDEIRDPSRVAAGVPKSARQVIFVDALDSGNIGNVDISDLDFVEVLGVHLEGERAIFFAVESGSLVETRQVPTELEELQLGAAVSGHPYLYNCARENFVSRSRLLTELYYDRALLLVDPDNIITVLPSCEGHVREALHYLNESHNDQNYLGTLNGHATNLAKLQSSLLAKSCPVIA